MLFRSWQTKAGELRCVIGADHPRPRTSLLAWLNGAIPLLDCLRM
jgi:hypothetical protein